ncbi:hypothetical protein MKX01_002398 [Papaver californicum]|nr:hypothetical protein MKX01_002398 [Papaver californicum]
MHSKCWRSQKFVQMRQTLRVAVAESILYHQTDIIGSPSFEEYAIQNPHLMMHIIRYFGTQFQ